MDFFSFNNTVPVLEVEEIYLHPEFKKVTSLVYNKNVDGDTTGAGRNQSKKFFRFLYFYCNWKSPYLAYDTNERRIEALKASGLGANYKLQPDEKAAVAFYEELLLKQFPEINILKTLKESQRLIEKGSKLYSEKLNQVIGKLEQAQLSETTEDIDNFASITNVYYKTLDQLLTVGDKVFKLTEDIKKIETNLKHVERELEFVKGGAVKKNRQD